MSHQAKENKDNYEPTLGEVFGVVRQGFERMEDHFERIEARLAVHDHRFDTVDDSITELRQRTGKVEVRLEDVREAVEIHADATDRSIKMLVDYDGRIKRLEKTIR